MGQQHQRLSQKSKRIQLLKQLQQLQHQLPLQLLSQYFQREESLPAQLPEGSLLKWGLILLLCREVDLVEESRWKMCRMPNQLQLLQLLQLLRHRQHQHLQHPHRHH